MIPKECKRLAEVDFPIAVVSKHAAREKSIRHGHPSTLHLWWARRPLAACRAMLLALLLPDPCDEHCPDEFKKQARDLLPQVVGTIKQTDEALRQALLKFIGDFANWDRSAYRIYLEVSRGLIKAAHLPAEGSAQAGGEEAPLVVDPFAGGGSIPLEALRLGCDAFASDLNPVACLILKVLLEDIPRHGPELAEELRRVGAEIKAAAEKELADFYPPDSDGARPIAYLWARTVRCESTGCGAEIPLVRSFWLSKKANRKRALRYKVVRPRGDVPRVEFEIFEPKKDSDVPNGTVSRAKAACPCCNVVLSPERVRAQLSEQRGGADVVFDRKGQRIGGARLLAVVTLHDNASGRQYRVTTDRDYETVWAAQKALEKVASTKLPNGLSPVPDEPLPPQGTLGFRVQLYGMLQWGDLFTARQKLALVILAHAVRERPESGSDAVREAMAIIVDRCADYNSASCRWVPRGEYIGNSFGRQALPSSGIFAKSASSPMLPLAVTKVLSTGSRESSRRGQGRRLPRSNPQTPPSILFPIRPQQSGSLILPITTQFHTQTFPISFSSGLSGRCLVIRFSVTHSIRITSSRQRAERLSRMRPRRSPSPPPSPSRGEGKRVWGAPRIALFSRRRWPKHLPRVAEFLRTMALVAWSSPIRPRRAGKRSFREWSKADGSSPDHGQLLLRWDRAFEPVSLRR